MPAVVLIKGWSGDAIRRVGDGGDEGGAMGLRAGLGDSLAKTWGLWLPVSGPRV